MKYSELINLSAILKTNPNIPFLKNENKIKLLRINRAMKSEMELFTELEKTVFSTYEIDESKGDINEQSKELKSTDETKFKQLVKDLEDLRSKECEMKIEPIEPDEFWALVKEKVILSNGNTHTYCLSLDEIDLVSAYLLKEKE